MPTPAQGPAEGTRRNCCSPLRDAWRWSHAHRVRLVQRESLPRCDGTWGRLFFASNSGMLRFDVRLVWLASDI
jgi:hypothetical protein